MDDTTKSIIKAVAVASLEKIGMAAGTALVAKGLLAPGQLGGFDQIFVGFIIGVASVAWAWYRANGAALVEAELKKMRAIAETAAAEAELKHMEMQHQLDAAKNEVKISTTEAKNG